ncbi:hypothetical protein ACLKA6_013950 [Drosophila palustris]
MATQLIPQIVNGSSLTTSTSRLIKTLLNGPAWESLCPRAHPLALCLQPRHFLHARILSVPFRCLASLLRIDCCCRY